jgi:hypothetical protein
MVTVKSRLGQKIVMDTDNKEVGELLGIKIRNRFED